MFDRTYVTAPRGPSRVDVHEHRAPTDASVRLLKEMEEKAEAKVIDAVQVEGNEFHGVLQVAQDFASDSAMAKVVLDINGHRYTVEASRPNYKADEIPTALRDDLARQLAGRMLHALFSQTQGAIQALAPRGHRRG